jgi:hypothetical protein
MPKILRLSVQNLTMEQLLTQYRPGCWTVQQLVHHMADNDMNAFIRFKKALTEDNHLDIVTQRYAWHSKHHIAQIDSLKQRMGCKKGSCSILVFPI